MCLPLLEWEGKMLGFFFCKICFVGMFWTLDHELRTVNCNVWQHQPPKKLPVQLKNKSECIWKLLGDVWEVWNRSWSRFGASKDPLGSVLSASWDLLGRFWELQNRSWAHLKGFWARQSDLGSIVEWFWSQNWSQNLPPRRNKLIWNASKIHACAQTPKADFERPSYENWRFWDV